ncbi:MAG: hypothetical protein PVG22_04020, partial [Chromatiales bacterium]
ANQGKWIDCKTCSQAYDRYYTGTPNDLYCYWKTICQPIRSPAAPIKKFLSHIHTHDDNTSNQPATHRW